MGFGGLLQELRIAKEVSLREMGKEVGLSAIYISDMERGHRRAPSSEVILRIADYLQTDPAPLLRAALAERRTVEFELTEGQTKGARGDFILALARVWNEMEDEAFEALNQHLEQDKERKDKR